jgi:hypothetical protein
VKYRQGGILEVEEEQGEVKEAVREEEDERKEKKE